MDLSSIFSTWFQTIHFLELRYSDIPRGAVTRNTSCVSFRSNIFETHGTFVLLSVESSSGTNEVYISHPRLVTEHRDDHCSPSRHEIVEVEKKRKEKKRMVWRGKSEGTDRFIVCNRENGATRLDPSFFPFSSNENDPRRRQCPREHSARNRGHSEHANP